MHTTNVPSMAQNIYSLANLQSFFRTAKGKYYVHFDIYGQTLSGFGQFFAETT